MKVILFALLFGLVNSKPAKKQEPLKDGFQFFQGDMLMTDRDIHIATNGGDIDEKHQPKKQDGPLEIAYGLQRNRRYRWPNKIIPYVISNDLKSFLGVLDAEKEIKQAMREWESKTCLKFVPKKSNHRDYVHFINGGIGRCYSHVGRIGGRQVLSLGFGCRSKGTALHEIGHAIGLHHEHSRPDRDDHVKIIHKNIKSSMKGNFKKYSVSLIDTLGVPYDTGSIMHYKNNAFAKWPWQKTIVPLKKGASIGQRKRLSTNDVKQVNKYYEC